MKNKTDGSNLVIEIPKTKNSLLFDFTENWKLKGLIEAMETKNNEIGFFLKTVKTCLKKAQVSSCGSSMCVS